MGGGLWWSTTKVDDETLGCLMRVGGPMLRSSTERIGREVFKLGGSWASISTSLPSSLGLAACSAGVCEAGSSLLGSANPGPPPAAADWPRRNRRPAETCNVIPGSVTRYRNNLARSSRDTRASAGSCVWAWIAITRLRCTPLSRVVL